MSGGPFCWQKLLNDTSPPSSSLNTWHCTVTFSVSQEYKYFTSVCLFCWGIILRARPGIIHHYDQLCMAEVTFLHKFERRNCLSHWTRQTLSQPSVKSVILQSVERPLDHCCHPGGSAEQKQLYQELPKVCDLRQITDWTYNPIAGSLTSGSLVYFILTVYYDCRTYFRSWIKYQ